MPTINDEEDAIIASSTVEEKKTIQVAVAAAFNNFDGASVSSSASRQLIRPKRQLIATAYAAWKVIGYCNTMFNTVVAIGGITSYFIQPTTAELYNQINNIQKELDEVQEGLGQLMAEIADASMRTQYVSAQRVVKESLRLSAYYANVTEEVANGNTNVTPDDVDYWRSEVAKWGSLLRESVTFLMDGFLGENVIAGDLLKYIVDANGPNVSIFLLYCLNYLIPIIGLINFAWRIPSSSSSHHAAVLS